MSPDILYIIITAVFVLVIGFDIYSWSQTHTFVKPELKTKRLKKIANFSVFILGFTLTVISISFHVNIFKYEYPIEYADIDNITLKDFRGYKIPNNTLDGNKKFAFITTSIEWKQSGDVIELKSVFHPARSYVFNQNIIDDLLLKHELYHFRITEYFARKARMKIKNYKGIPSRETISYIVSTAMSLEKEMQHNYDDETYHGYILKEQKKWQLKIDSLLSSSRQYSNVNIYLK